MYHKHRKFFSFGLLSVFALFFLYLIYDHKYNIFSPKPPAESYIIPASDSASFPNVLQYDFENVKDYTLVTDEQAFSGKNALKVSGKRCYSPTIQIPFTNKKLQGFFEALFGAWIFTSDSSKPLEGKLILQIVDKSNKLKYSAATDIKDQKPKANLWFYVCGKADWKNCKVLPTDFVKIYFWNNSNNTVYIDDVQIVFGKQEIKGVKPLTDNTSENYNYSPVRNQPPYPAIYFEKEYISNTKNTIFFQPNGKDSLEFTSGDVFLKGSFIKNKIGNEQLIIFRNDKPYALFWYEPRQTQLLFIRFKAELFSGYPAFVYIVAADVNGDGADEIICVSENSNEIHVFGYNTFSKKAGLISEESCGAGMDIRQIQKFRINNNRSESLFVTDTKGQSFLLNFEKNKWNNYFLGYITEAAQIGYESRIISGNFIKAGGNDNILVLYRNKNSGRCFYKLFEIDPESGKNLCLQQGNFDKKCDTLYPQNNYFTCDVDNDNISELISCSNGWRYDTKLVKFDKDGYFISANIDFAGYPKDYNPKYFEKLTIVVGNFIEKDKISFFTFCGSTKNKKNIYNNMPPYIGIYSYKNKPSKP